MKYFLDETDAESVDRFVFFKNKNAKYLFHKFNDLLCYNKQHTISVRHSKIAENEVVMKEGQSRD